MSKTQWTSHVKQWISLERHFCLGLWPSTNRHSSPALFRSMFMLREVPVSSVRMAKGPKLGLESSQRSLRVERARQRMTHTGRRRLEIDRLCLQSEFSFWYLFHHGKHRVPEILSIQWNSVHLRAQRIARSPRKSLIISLLL